MKKVISFTMFGVFAVLLMGMGNFAKAAGGEPAITGAIALYSDLNDGGEVLQYNDGGPGRWYAAIVNPSRPDNILNNWTVMDMDAFWRMPLGLQYHEGDRLDIRARIFDNSEHVGIPDPEGGPYYKVFIPWPYKLTVQDSNGIPVSGVNANLGAAGGNGYDERFSGVTNDSGTTKMVIPWGFNNSDNTLCIHYGGCDHYTAAIQDFQMVSKIFKMPPMSKFIIRNALGENIKNVPVYVVGAKDNKVYNSNSEPLKTNENGEVEFSVPSKLYGDENGWKFAYGYAGTGYLSNETFVSPVNYTQTVVAINRPVINSISIVSGQAGTLRFAWEDLGAKGVAKYLIRIKTESAVNWTNLGVTQATALNISGFNNPDTYMFQVYGYNDNNQLITYSQVINFTINESKTTRNTDPKHKESLSSSVAYTSSTLSTKAPEAMIESLNKMLKANEINVTELKTSSNPKIIKCNQ